MAGRIYIDLVLDNGDLVRIECPGKYENELYESIENTMRTRQWWSPESFDGCSAQFQGMYLERVNMGRVVGIL